MKAISVKLPFALKIAQGIKSIECRSWTTKFRGEILICASKSTEYIHKLSPEKVFLGKALCIVKIKDCRLLNEYDLVKACIDKHILDVNKTYYAWEIELIRCITPFDVRGQQRIFQVDYELKE